MLNIAVHDLDSGLSTMPYGVRSRVLLYSMGPEAHRPLQSFPLPTKATYDAVVMIFTEYLVHPMNEVHETSRFNRQMQLSGESVDGFDMKLTRLVKKCNREFPAFEERLVCDRFAVRLRDTQLSD